MDDDLYIVIYRFKSGGKWKAQSEGIFEGPEAERLARNYAECLNVNSIAYEHRVVHGPLVSPETLADAQARLGAF